MDRASSFRRVIAELDHFDVPNLDVIAYDRRGYGESLHQRPAESFDDHVDDLFTVIGDAPAVVVGHSLGGDVALAAAAHRPDLVLSVVAYEPPMPWQPWWPADTAGGAAVAAKESPEDAAEAFVRRMVGDKVWDRLPPSVKEQRRAEGRALMAELLAVQNTAVVDPAKVTVPVVLGVGGNGRDHHQLNTRKLVEMLPDALLVEIPGAAHGAHLSHPKPFAELIRMAVTRASAG
jgi:pimeloyl-ACP methyl ester carboxylesterase